MNVQAWAPRILSVFRVLAGLMFACHGAQKVLGWFGGLPPEAKGWMLQVAGPMELFGGILIALGLFTRPVAFLLSGMMAVGYFHGHAPGGFLPKVNGGEPAVLYCWLFLYFWAQGPGAWALDNLWKRRVPAGATGS
ncbi:MAG TPA: DoxX family protein [Thermoanaerobaculia bacterium]|jgi:putative oxidoreductase